MTLRSTALRYSSSGEEIEKLVHDRHRYRVIVEGALPLLRAFMAQIRVQPEGSKFFCRASLGSPTRR